MRVQGKFQEVLSSYFEDVEDLELATEEQRQLARRRLASSGVRLGEDLLPGELRRLLWSLREHRPAPSLLLLSNETWIPWELIRLRETEDNDPAVSIVAAGDGIGGNEDEDEGVFLAELFALTRWLREQELHLELPLEELGLVVPKDTELAKAPEEREDLKKLFPEAREVTPKTLAVMRSLESAAFDAIHFTGYGIKSSQDPNRGGIFLEDQEVLKPSDLNDAARNLGQRHPWIFFNACHSARGLFALSGLGGFAEAFLRAGAGAFLGAYWQVPDDKAKEFALAVYEYFVGGLPLGEAVRRARDWLRTTYPGDPTFLAYAAYGHPLALRDEAIFRWSLGDNLPLTIPNQSWTEEDDSPAGLLRAERSIVPFHGRDRESGELEVWCDHQRRLAVRLLTGDGGMGKTRLLIEIAKLRQEAGWLAGFLTQDEADRAPTEAWDALIARGKPLFLVIDYAETRRNLLVPIIRGMLESRALTRGPKVRLVLLARKDQDWWRHLWSEGDGVGDFLQGPATSNFSLQALADDSEGRIESYWTAARRFSDVLGRPMPDRDPGSLTESYFKRVLFIHMTALAAVEGSDLRERDPILDYFLHRERRFWRRLADARSLGDDMVRGIGRAMGALTLGGGAKTQLEALSSLRQLRFFAAKDPQLLEDVARVLHDCYAGDKQFIAPLQPDPLGEHLIHREMQQGADDLIDLVFR